jgi:hypothetical protein
MAILRTIGTEEKDWPLWGANIPDRCFYCDKPLSFPLVYWHGCKGETGSDDVLQIWLHPRCAWRLGHQIAEDAHKTGAPIYEPGEVPKPSH